ncbi:MAG TPA: CGNR zinc finger domain-containing protein [Gemmatimonadales bacterium]|nr:CGNR zinc finger domain-containing protein [Gemmatimonadales bacterium]
MDSFQYIGGDPAIDFVNTVDWTSRGPEQERLTDFDAVIRWAEGAEIVSAKAAGGLRARSRAQPGEAESAHRNALRVRTVLERLFRSIAGGESDGDALDDFNRELTRALERMRVAPVSGKRPAGPGLQLDWDVGEASLDSVIWPVVWSAASLIVSEEASRIRICGGPDCGWMYVDRSRNGLRRWCQMKTCGTSEKSRRRYQRLRENNQDLGRSY